MSITDEREPLAIAGEHPDFAQIIVERAADIVVDGEPLGLGACGTWSNVVTPTRYVQVTPLDGAGGLDTGDRVTDRGVWVARCRAETRDVARSMLRQLRASMRELAETHEHRGVLVDRCAEAGPPAVPPGEDPDERPEEMSWVLSARPHRGDTVPALA